MTLDEVMKLLTEALSGARAKEVVARIAAHHRIQGSPGFLDAAREVQGILTKDGILSRLHSFPADGRTKTFGWMAPLSWSVRSGSLRQLTPTERTLVRFDEIPQGVLAHSRGGKGEADLAHVGEGTSAEDYEGADVSGRFVLASGRPQEVVPLAVARGAVGVILYPTSQKAFPSPDLVQYAGFWPDAAEAGRTPLGFSISRRQADLVQADLRRGPVRLAGEVDADLGPGELHVLEAWIEGTSPEEREVLLVAHLCHPRPSANDNASGSGLLVEIARTLASLSRTGKVLPERSVRFLFVPEFYGTLPWAAAHRETVARTLYVLNLDMVGQSPERLGEPLRVWRAPGRNPTPLDAWFSPLLSRIADDPAAIAPGGTRRPMNWRLEPPGGGSDHIVFSDPVFDVPAVMLGHDDPLHHTHQDDLDMVDPTELARVGLLAASLAVLPGLLPDEARRLTAWLLDHGTRSLVRAAEIGSDEGTRGALLDLAFNREGRRVEAFRVLLEEGGVNWNPTPHRRALAATREALLDGPLAHREAASTRSPAARPRKAFQGPLPYSAYRSLPREDRRFLEEEFSGPYGILPLEALNLADGTRTEAEIALELTLEFERAMGEETVSRALSILERGGWVARE